MRPLLWVLCGCSLLAGTANAAVEVLSVPGRDFGYVIGDVVTHRFSVLTPPDQVLEHRYLPHPGPLENGLELRHIEWQSRADGTRMRHDFRLDYQIFKGVRQAESVELPPLTLQFSGASAGQVSVPGARFSLNPLIPATLADDQVVSRNVSPLSEAAPAPDQRRSWLYGSGFAVASGLWLYRRLRRQPGPFERLLAEWPLRITAPADKCQRLRQLHAAFNQQAGYTLMESGLDDFFAAHPAFQPLQAEIRWFFGVSEQWFFAAVEPAETVDVVRLRALCRACARVDRRRC